VKALPQGLSSLASAARRVKDDPQLGSDGRVWPAVLELWAYSALSGILAIAAGHVMVSLTRVVLPPLPVRLGSIGAVVVAAGLAAEYVLEHLKRLVGRDHS